MRFHLPTSCAIGLAFAATMAGVAGAQVTQQHIPVRKEAADTTKKDTVVTMPAPMPAPEPAPAPMPAPEPAPAPAPAPAPVVEAPEHGGPYFGIGGGLVFPMGQLKDGVRWGPAAIAMLGWQSEGVFGIRADVDWDHFRGKELVGGGKGPAATNWEFNGNITLNFPFGDSGSSFYLLGGGGYDHFSVKGGNSTSKPAVDGGAGLNFGMSSLKLFLESRYVVMFTDKADVGSNHLKFVPVVIGLRF